MYKIELTEQEIFNKVWQHAVVEQQPFSRPFNSSICYYRGPEGSKCYVGILIPDEHYKPEMDKVYGELGTDCASLQKRNLLDFSVSGHFLRGIQIIHDSSKDHVHAEAQLRKFAEKFSLEIPA